MLSALAFTALQSKELIEVRPYSGGDLRSYVRFMVQNKKLESGAFAYQEDPTLTFGLNRARVFSDGSILLDHPVENLFLFGTVGSLKTMSFRTLPSPYVIKVGDSPISLEDTIEQNTPPNKTSVGGFRGSLILKNQLFAIDQNLAIHPFFDSMRIRVSWSGTQPKGAVEAIARMVGGTLIRSNDPSNKSRIIPDAKIIRERALRTLEYYHPGPRRELHFREQLLRHLIATLSESDFLKWLDATDQPVRSRLEDPVSVKILSKFTDSFKLFLSKTGTDRIKNWTLDELDWKNVEIEYRKNLEFSLTLLLPDGTKLIF